MVIAIMYWPITVELHRRVGKDIHPSVQDGVVI